jgi:hypothetical protein
MNVILTGGKGGWSVLVTAIKAYTLLGPLVLVILMRGIGLDGPTGVGLVAAGYGVSFLMLLAFGFLALSSEQRAVARSDFVFAGIALLWILVLAVVLPSLAST